MKFYDAFCGIGGFHKGITQAHPDWECSGACDIDKYARIIYNKHFPEVDMDGDVKGQWQCGKGHTFLLEYLYRVK